MAVDVGEPVDIIFLDFAKAFEESLGAWSQRKSLPVDQHMAEESTAESGPQR